MGQIQNFASTFLLLLAKALSGFVQTSSVANQLSSPSTLALLDYQPHCNGLFSSLICGDCSAIVLHRPQDWKQEFWV